MEKKIKEIIRHMGNIAEKTSNLMDGGITPSIEVDIILQDIRMLYEEVKNLHTEQSTETPAPPEIQETSDNIAISNPSSEVQPEPGNEPKNEPRNEPTTLADRYKGEKKYFNESLSNTERKQDIGSKMQSKPIRSIGSALGINDRFKLINDLFKGDKDSFQNTITVLEDAQNFNEAFNYINSSFDWHMEDESVQILLELVRRKFIVNENE